MSHVRRKRSTQSVRTIRKNKNEKKWLVVFVLLLLFMGTIIGVVLIFKP